MSLYVSQLWRYPVKSLAGEMVSSILLTPDGMAGDRIVRVRGPEGVRNARRYYRLLGLHGSLDSQGRALIDGRPWDSAEALSAVRNAAGGDAWLEACEEPDRFDILPLLVATDGAVAAFGRDIRRLRPNIVIGGVEGLAEREWAEHELRIGNAMIRLDSMRSRCVMTTIDPDTLRLDADVLRDIVRRFENKLALNAEVIRGGELRVHDPVALL
jgi:uncharacterized protein YcbX